MRDCLLRGDAPFASHKLYAGDLCVVPGALDDAVASERALGIAAGFTWAAVAEVTAVYVDRGISDGMLQGIRDAHKAKRPVEYWSIDSGKGRRVEAPLSVPSEWVTGGSF